MQWLQSRPVVEGSAAVDALQVAEDAPPQGLMLFRLNPCGVFVVCSMTGLQRVGKFRKSLQDFLFLIKKRYGLVEKLNNG